MKNQLIKFIVNQQEEFGWLSIQIKPREEKRARENLTNQGFESYFPNIYSLPQHSRNSQIKKEPMFPGYAFIKVSHNIELKSLNSTRGVIKIIRFGDEYPLLDHKDIVAIQSIEDASFKDPKQETYKIGEQIIIISGPLKDQKGIISKKASNQRVEILYMMLNRAHLINMQIENISKY